MQCILDGGATLRACTPVVLAGDVNRINMFPATAMEMSAIGCILLESEQEKTNMHSASRCIGYFGDNEFLAAVNKAYRRFNKEKILHSTSTYRNIAFVGEKDLN